MALQGSSKFVFVFVILFLCVNALDFEVGGEDGWVVPSSRDDDVYNQWASKNRFHVGDTIYFKYKKDSVLVVTEEEYNNCDSSQPLFFSNSGGGSNYTFDRSGLFYFISGVTGHCKLGQKMIIKVLSPLQISQAPSSSLLLPPPPAPHSDHVGHNDASRVRVFQAMPLVVGMVLACSSLILN
ncbi:hypothetical protein LUZ60_012022 [Juncus effusus]|nr:hypothetical protein LUZ60_012022 [Juncus effusus]